MKRKIIIGIITTLMATSLSGCGINTLINLGDVLNEKIGGSIKEEQANKKDQNDEVNKIMKDDNVINDSKSDEENSFSKDESLEKEIESIDIYEEVNVINPTKVCATSSLKPTESYNYYPSNAFDNNTKTAWVEGTDGFGYRSSITMFFPKKLELKSLKLINGYSKNEDIYYKNNRVKTVEIKLSNGETITKKLKDGILDFQTISLDKGVVTDSIDVTVIDVYKGSKYNDTAISEIQAVGLYVE